MKRIMKSYRMGQKTINELEAIKKYYDEQTNLKMTETDIIEFAISAMYFSLAMKGHIKEGD